jgi:hypothetical protein
VWGRHSKEGLIDKSFNKTLILELIISKVVKAVDPKTHIAGTIMRL